MLRINYTFDKELGPDGMDPLGDLVISDDRSEIAITETYLDSWLAGFIEAIPQLSINHHATVETEERDQMQLDVAPEGHLAISFKDHTVVAAGVQEFETALRAAVNSFLEVLINYPDAWKNRDIDAIRRFWAATKN